MSSPAQSAANTITGGTQGNTAGATMQTQYMGRTMNCYPVSEAEMELLSSLGAQVTVRTATGSFLLAISVSIWVSAMFATALTPAGELASKFAAPLLLLFSFGFYFGAAISYFNRRSKWADLKRTSKPVQMLV
jgi:hypothetical protein